MKRITIAAVAAAFVVVVAGGAFALSRDDDGPAVTPSSDVESSRDLAAENAEAMKDLREQTAQKSDEEAKSRSTKSQRLVVTIRDERPYDAYKPAAAGNGCIRAADVPAQLVVVDNTTDDDVYKVLAEPEIPAAGKLTSSGACEAKITVDVPFTASYRLGVAIEGHGISLPTDPGETEVEAGKSPQAVVVRR